MFKALARWTGLESQKPSTQSIKSDRDAESVKPMRVPSVLLRPPVDETDNGGEVIDSAHAVAVDAEIRQEDSSSGDENSSEEEAQPESLVHGFQAHPNRAKQKLHYINDQKAMQAVIGDFGILQKLPFIETMCYTNDETMSSLGMTDVEDALTREAAFAKQAIKAVEMCKPKILDAGVPFTRPQDYFAEMVKDDAHMAKIRQRMLDEKSSIEASQKARQLRELKKLGKQIQVQKTKDRAAEKRNMNERVADLKKKSRDALDRRVDDMDADGMDDAFDVEVEEAIGDQRSQRSGGGDKRMSRTGRNARFGFAKKSKQNDRKSHEAFDRMVPGKKGRGRGMGKGRPNRGNKRLGKSRRK